MRILKLHLINFQGIKDFTLDIEGNNAQIMGDNGTGKTTICNAFTWLLFDKNFVGQKDFSIKTLDASGEPIHNLNHEVEAVFNLNGKRLTLKKVYAEKWTKKRGSATATFTGHTVDHFVNGVPVKKGEYDTTVSSIASEDIFKLLTSPIYFNEQLHWQDRRKILTDICGDLTDEEVITSDSAFTNLPQILNGRALGDHKKVIAARRAEINKELDKIPVRIDEANRSLPELPTINDKGQYNALIANFKTQRSEKAAELARTESGGEVAEKQRQIAEIETELIRIKNQHEADNGAVVGQRRNELFSIDDNVLKLNSNINASKLEIERRFNRIEQLDVMMDTLRSSWRTINDQVFEYEQSDTCPTCGQLLPKEQVEQAREKALAAFNTDKAERLGNVNAEGKKLKIERDKLQKEADELANAVLKIEQEVAINTEKQKALKDEIARLQMSGKPIADNPSYTQKLKEKESLEATIIEIKSGNQAAFISIQNQIDELDQGVSDLTADLQRIELREAGLKRIDELKAQEKTLAAEFEKLEGELFLAEQFTRAKVAMLEKRINSKFKMAKFKLFNPLVNGGLEECAEVMYNGVPYSSGLNNGHRGIVGLDIIATLADHYNFYPPIFYDNAESVTRLPEMKSQMICLYVSEADKKLRVEVENKNLIKEAV